MDVVDMEIVDDPDEPRPSNVVAEALAEREQKGSALEQELAAETDVAPTEVSEALAEAASGRIDDQEEDVAEKAEEVTEKEVPAHPEVKQEEPGELEEVGVEETISTEAT